MTIAIRRLKNGEPRYRAWYRRNGVSTSKTFLSKYEAQLWLEELDRLVLGSQFVDKPFYTFEEVIDRYLKEITPEKKSKRGEYFRLKRFMKNNPELIKMFITDIQAEHINEWQQVRLTQVKSNSVCREKSTLSDIFTKAIKWQYCAYNPVKQADTIKEPPPRNRRYREEEIRKLVSVSGYDPHGENRTQKARTGAALLFAIETAMRAGEIYKLTWEHVNLERRTAFLPETKNGHTRTVPLSGKAIDILHTLARLKPEKTGQIFGFSSDQMLSALFRKIKKEAGLENANLRFHDTRREALSRLATKFNPMELAKISGHRDFTILQNTYYAPDISEFASRLA